MIDASDIFSAAFKVCLPDVVAQVSHSRSALSLSPLVREGLMRSSCSSRNPFVAGPIQLH